MTACTRRIRAAKEHEPGALKFIAANAVIGIDLDDTEFGGNGRGDVGLRRWRRARRITPGRSPEESASRPLSGVRIPGEADLNRYRFSAFPAMSLSKRRY